MGRQMRTGSQHSASYPTTLTFMQNFLRVLTLCSFLLASLAAHADVFSNIPPGPPLNAKAWMLIDAHTGQVLVHDNENLRAAPASLTKLMTAYLVFSALQDGRLTLTTALPISSEAWKQGGSRMFLLPNTQVPVDELLKGMLVPSGNDAAYALAEGVGGSAAGFVSLMNREAKTLGLNGTHYMDPNGLPDPGHYTTARDLATLARDLVINFPQYYHRFFHIKEFSYNNITQPNTNRLLWLDPQVDGIKTGYTEEAGYCLVASAKRGDQRLISVVLGAPSNQGRVMDSLKLLNYGFQFYSGAKLYGAGQVVKKVAIYKGAANHLPIGFLQDFYLTLPRGGEKQLDVQVITREPLLAPVMKGQQVGTLHLTLDGKPYGDYPLVALDTVKPAGFFGRLWDSIKLFFMRWF